jgi:hypothetical protein
MKVDPIGVHTTHCCEKCGCKYGDSGCPVELGLMAAEFPCQNCEEAREELLRRFELMSLPELSETIGQLQEIRERKSRDKDSE